MFSRAPWSLQSILSASIKRNETKLLASPNIMVTDNDQANIFVGDTLRVQTAQASVNGQTTQIQEFPIGIIMLIRPRVNVDGVVTLRVHPAVSSITALDKSTGIPQTSEREADTNIMTKDGETIVIGGLIREEDLRTVQEVPILAQLPIIGELFRTRTHDKRRKEVLVFITTHIVKDGENPFGPDPKTSPQKHGLGNKLEGIEKIKP